MRELITGVFKHTLSNGMRVLLCPSSRVDLACVLTWVKSGYFHESDDVSGISHLIEHMLFKGTKKRGVGEIAMQTKALGGYLNASTTYDHTSYHTIVPAKFVHEALDIQSDVLLNPLFDAKELEREKEVVFQEMKKKLDQPHAFAREKLFELAFEKHRMRRWRIGTEESLLTLSKDRVLDYYNHHYTPENIIVVVSGKFNADDVIKTIERLYEPMTRVEGQVSQGPSEPEQTQPKMKRIKGDLSQVIVKMGFHTVPVTHADYPALSCLSILLGKGRSSRFYKTLKEDKQFVHGVGCSQIAFQDIGYFVIESEVKQDFVPQTEEEIFSEIGRLAREPAHALEMKRIHSIIESSFFRDKEDVMGQAMSLAYHESMGDYQRVLKQIDAIRSQTALDLNRVAEKYFRFENMSLLEYVPHELGDGAEVENRLDSLKKRVEKKHEILKEPIESLPRKPVSPLSWDFTTMKPGSKSREVISLEAGVTLLYQHVPGVPLVSIHAYFPGGRKDENEKNCGITQFLLKTSLKGTENRTADEVFFDLESLGTSVHPESNADHFGYATSLLSEDFEKGIEILSDILFNPIFPETEIEKERSVVLSLINRIKDDMFYHPIELFYRALYGSHPYGLPRNGTPESVKSFTRSQLLDWYAQIFSFRHLVVSVVGDIPKERVIREIQNGFSLQPDTSPISLAEVYPFVHQSSISKAIEERTKAQTAMTIGFQGVTHKDSRYYTLEVIRNLFSGMGGRLFSSLREKTPLVYTVTAFNLGLHRSGAFFVYAAFNPKHEKQCWELLMNEFKKLKETTVPIDELNIAKSYTISAHEMSLQTNSMMGFSLAHHYLVDSNFESYDLYNERIQSVTPEMIKQTAQSLFDENRYALGIVRGQI